MSGIHTTSPGQPLQFSAKPKLLEIVWANLQMMSSHICPVVYEIPDVYSETLSSPSSSFPPPPSYKLFDYQHSKARQSRLSLPNTIIHSILTLSILFGSYSFVLMLFHMHSVRFSLLSFGSRCRSRFSIMFRTRFCVYNRLLLSPFLHNHTPFDFALQRTASRQPS